MSFLAWLFLGDKTKEGCGGGFRTLLLVARQG
jgi:hypothetical protein